MSQHITPPRLNAADLSTHDLCRLYRILDNLEEIANMALQHVVYLDGHDTKASTYVDALGEYLGEERCNIVNSLRARPNTFDNDGERRLATIIQFEAWCQEFNKSTLDEFAANPLAINAV